MCKDKECELAISRRVCVCLHSKPFPGAIRSLGLEQRGFQ